MSIPSGIFNHAIFGINIRNVSINCQEMRAKHMGSSCNLLVCLEQGPPLELCKRPGVPKIWTELPGSMFCWNLQDEGKVYWYIELSQPWSPKVDFGYRPLVVSKCESKTSHRIQLMNHLVVLQGPWSSFFWSRDRDECGHLGGYLGNLLLQFPS